MKAARIASLAVCAALVVGAVGVARAQYPGGGGGGTGGAAAGTSTIMRHGGAAPEGREPATAGVPAADLASGQLDDLQIDLKLAPAQREAWNNYVKRVRQLIDDVTRSRNALRFPKGAAPEQLDLVAETMRNRLTAIEDISDAGKALYAVLTSAQKSVADDRLARIPIPLIAPLQGSTGVGVRAVPPVDASPNAGKGR